MVGIMLSSSQKLHRDLISLISAGKASPASGLGLVKIFLNTESIGNRQTVGNVRTSLQWIIIAAPNRGN